MNTNKIIFIFPAIMLLLYSCNNGTNAITPQNMSDYFPTTIGSWWKYENWVLDSNAVRVKKISVDSIVVEGTAVIDGKSAVVLVTYHLQNDTMTKVTNYNAIEGSKLFSYYDLTFSDGDSIPWITSADLSGSDWLMAEKDIKNENDNVKNEYYIKITGSKGTLQDYNYKSQIIKAQEIITYSIQRTSTITKLDSLLTDLESTNSDLYSKGIGFVHSLYMMTVNRGFPIQGYETVLIDNMIK